MSLIYSTTQLPKPQRQILHCLGGCGARAELITHADDEAVYVCDECEKKFGKPPMEEMPKRSYREI